MSVTLELHEHEVPDFDVTIAIGVRAAGRAARDVRPMIVEDLGAGTAGPRVAHHPEIVFLAATGQALGINPDIFKPDIGRLIIRFEDRHPQAVSRQPKALREQLPREFDCFALEIIAETEIAEHLEERVMTCGIPHIVQIVMLASGAHAALTTRRAFEVPRFEAEEHILELHHAGIGEKQRRIVARHQWATGHRAVSFAREIVEEFLADFVSFHASVQFVLGIQYRFDLLGGEAPIFQIASTLDGDRQRLVGVNTKFLAIGACGQVKPIALGLAQRALDHFRARATLLEFEGNALRPVTAFRA